MKNQSNNYRITEEMTGFYIEKETVYTEKHFFGLLKKVKTKWVKISTTKNPFLFEQIIPFNDFESAKADLEKIKDLPKYYY